MRRDFLTIRVFIFLCAFMVLTANRAFGIMDSEVTNFKNPFISELPAKVSTKPETSAAPVSQHEAPRKEIKPPTLIIQGLVWNTNRPQAIVNKKVLGIGDRVDEATIVNITKTGIDILYQEKLFFVPYANP